MHVPRLDRWVQALQLAKSGAAYDEFPQLVFSQSVGSGLVPGADSSAQCARKMIFCMSEVQSAVDRDLLDTAVKSSIAIDKTSDCLLLCCRCLVTVCTTSSWARREMQGKSPGRSWNQ